MMGTANRVAGREIGRLFREGSLAGWSDGELLDRYATDRDPAAFEALVSRHGGMVRRTCRDVLGNDADADDACQATFVRLIDRAGSIRSRESLAGWLHRVAVRTAIRHRASSALRKAREERSAAGRPGESAEAPDDLARSEIRRALQAEVDRLPDRYRRPVILCYLEGVSQAEAAARLGRSEGSIRGRLARGKALLRSRLARRGIAPAAIGLAMAELAGAEVGSAASTGLAGWIVAKLAAVLLALGATIAAATLAAPPVPPPGVAPLAAPEPRQDPAPVAKVPEAGGSVAIRGRVVDPQGRPVPGARVYTIADWVADPVLLGVAADGSFRGERPEKDFARNFSAGANNPGKTFAQVFATAEGFGIGWVVLDPLILGQNNEMKMRPDYDLTIRLVEDFPISGRLVSPDGRPVAGASVAIEGIDAPLGGDFGPVMADLRKHELTHYYDYPGPMWIGPHGLARAGVFPTVTTGADGRYRFAGIGRDRRVGLAASGAGLSSWKWISMTRDDLDDETARAIREITPRPGTKGVQAKVAWGARHEPVHGSRAEVVIEPARTVAGTIRDAKTGRFLPGIKLYVGPVDGEASGWVVAQTDAQGRYRAERADAQARVMVRVESGERHAYLGAARELSGVSGLGEVVADFALEPGTVVSGRVVEAGTFRPMVARDKEMCPDFPRAGFVRYLPLAGNPAVAGTELGAYYRHLWPWRVPGEVVATLRADGTFRVAVPPGPGVLLVETFVPEPLGGFGWQNPTNPSYSRRFPYVNLTRRFADDGAPRPEGGDPGSLPGAGGPIKLDPFVTYRVIDPPPSPGEVRDLTILVPRPPSRRIALVNPEGRPVVGALVSGLAPRRLGAETLPGDGIEVLALDPVRSRLLTALSPDGRFFARFEVRGDSAEPLLIRMQPAATLTGRLVNPQGRPMPGITPFVHYTDPAAVNPEFLFNPEEMPFVPHAPTAADGGFRIVGVLPGVSAIVSFTEPPGPPGTAARRHIPPRTRGLTLDVGEVRDLGKVEVPPTPK